MRYIRASMMVGATVCAILCIATSLCHEPDEGTIDFSSGPGEITSDTLCYYMVFTGDNADRVVWDFGDGTSAEAAEVYKVYEGPGDYNVMCQASNGNGDRYSAYVLHITESDYGVFDGYGTQILLMFLAFAFMIGSRSMTYGGGR